MDYEIIYKENSSILHKIAHKYKSWANTQGLTYDELISIGNLSFVLAVNSYDKERNTKFSTYLYSIVDNNIKEEILRSNSVVDIPLYIKKYAYLIQKEQNDYMPIEDLMVLYSISRKTAVEIHTYLQHKGVCTSSDVQESQYEPTYDNLIDLDGWIETLQHTDKSIIIDRINGLHNTDIAKKLGVSPVAIHKRLQRLRHSLTNMLQEG